MRKFLKIFGITIGSIAGVIVIAIAVAIWFVFTPERLTPAVKQALGEYITCQWEMGDVELTFFSTFPEFGLHIDGFYLINPMEGAQSDTVLSAPSVVAKLDVMEYLKNNNLVIHQVSLPDVDANIYINASGENNIDVFKIPTDTTAKDSTLDLPFDQLIVQSCTLQARHLSFVDVKDSISAQMENTNVSLTMTAWDDIHLSFASEDLTLQMQGDTYAQNIKVQMDLPLSLDLEQKHLRMNAAQLEMNELGLSLNGDASMGDTIAMDIYAQLDDWNIQSALSAFPFLDDILSDFDMDGQVSILAQIQGQYTDSVMPLIDAHVKIADAAGTYTELLPYVFSGVQADADVHLDLNHLSLSELNVHQLKANTLQTMVDISGTMKDFMGEQLTSAHVQLDANIPDLAYYLPEELAIKGHAGGTLDIETCIDDWFTDRMDRWAVSGQLRLKDLDMQADSMQVNLTDGSLTFDAKLNEWPLIKGTIDLQSSDVLTYASDSINARISAPKIHIYAAYDMQDTTKVPTFDASVQFNNLDGQYTTCTAHLGASKIDAKVTNSRRNQSVPVFSGTLSSGNLSAQYGNNFITTHNIFIDAKALYWKEGDKFLLRWNPILKFALNGAEVDLDGFEQHIRIPQIVFNYNNRDFDIINSNVILGNSDFSLTGDIHHIGKWLMGKGNLTGELNFTSNHTDVNELMALFSADSGSEEKSSPQENERTKSEDEPFLVPNNIDLSLNTHIMEASIFDQLAKNLHGKVYVKDGVLVLEEMGFVCDAAKLQLTAMYRTPRRDHIYVGLDYHMLDIKIDQLIDMIPQIDSLVPMLKSFKGEAEFHLAAETYLRSNYDIKTSTLRGACSIFGKDLVLMDSETFDKVSKILMFQKKTENIVDSISAEITVYKDEIEVYPFSISLDNYLVALGGKHKLDMSFNYHVNLLSPLYIGVDINGTMDNLNIKPAKCIYAKDFKPVIRKNADKQNAELRQMIRNSLRKNVKIQ